MDDKQSMAAKAIGIAVALGSAWVAQQAISRVWQATLGHKPPHADDEGDARFGEVAVAATITGALVALARVLATRGAAKLIK